jgi:hypothetical protein
MINNMRNSILAALLLCSCTLMAQSHVVSAGARGGLDFLMPQSDQVIQSKIGGAGALDAGYTYYWHMPDSTIDLGIHSGVSLGYAKNSASFEFAQKYTNVDYLQNEMQYTTLGTIDVSMQRIYAEIPIMFAFRTRGFFFEAGVKTQFAVWSRASQSLSNPHIDAYYVQRDVHVTDELIAGLVPQSECKKDFGQVAPVFNLLVGGRVGYEFCLGEMGRIGLSAYVDYNAYNTFKQSSQPVIAVAPVAAYATPPAVTVNNAFTSLVAGMHPVQVGISLHYAFEIKGKERVEPEDRDIQSDLGTSGIIE